MQHENCEMRNGVPVLRKELAEVNSDEATDLLGKHGKLIIEDPRFQEEKAKIEQRQVEHENKVYDRDQENLKNKEQFLDQLISMGYEIISHKVDYDGWMDGTHCIEAIVKKDGECKIVKLSTGDREPVWFLRHRSGGSSPLSLNQKPNIHRFDGHCPECNGKGETQMRSFDPEEPEDYYEPCHYCGGDGLKCKDCGAPADGIVCDAVTEDGHFINDRFLCNDCIEDLENKGGSQ